MTASNIVAEARASAPDSYSVVRKLIKLLRACVALVWVEEVQTLHAGLEWEVRRRVLAAV